MSMLAKLEEVQQLLIESDDLGAAMDRFLDLAARRDFLRLGTPARHPLLEKVLEAAASGAFGSDARISRCCLYWIESARFVHGAVLCGERPAMVLWFDGIQVGLLTVIDVRHADLIHHVRMSGFTVPM